MSTIRDDARIDPRIRQVFGAFPAPLNPGDATSRQQLVDEAGSEQAAAMRQRWDAFLERCDTEEIAPSAGLAITTRTLASEPDGNMINIRLIRPAGGEALPCVYYIHGGGMQSGSYSARQLSRLGQDHRRARRGGGDGGLPQRADALLRARDRAVPRRSQ